MENFEKAVIAANFYEVHKEDKELVMSYLQQTLSSVDAIIMLQDIRAELDMMQDMQDIMAYEKALENDVNAKPKKVEILISKHAVKDALNMTYEKITQRPAFIKTTLNMLSIVAYKYQLKYTYIVLNEMVQDAKVWNDVTYH